MLTKKQRDLLDFIHKRLQRDGVPPSFDEMKDALDLRSKSGIHRLITALEERGFIRRLAHRARAIEIVKFPDDMAPAGFQPTVIEGGKRRFVRPRVVIYPLILAVLLTGLAAGSIARADLFDLAKDLSQCLCPRVAVSPPAAPTPARNGASVPRNCCR